MGNNLTFNQTHIKGGMSAKELKAVFAGGTPNVSEQNIARLFNDWSARLRKIIDELQKLPDSMEGEFLRIGSELKEFYARAREIRDISTGVANTVSGGEIENAIEGLNNVLRQMEIHLNRLNNESEEYTSALNNVLNMLCRVEEELFKFKNLARTLHMLGISVRIQSTHLSRGDSSFENVSYNVKQLSGTIHTKSENILAKSAMLGSIIKQAASKIIEIENQRQSHARKILNSIRASMEVLTGIHDSCLNVAGYISTQLEIVSQNIGEVVAAMQFHDITRQQVEHVRGALADLCEKLRGEGAGSSSKAKLVSAVGDICELQAAQLSGSRDKFVGALDNVKESLRSISVSVRDMADKSCSITGVADGIGHSFLSEIEDGISSVLSSFSETAESSRELSKVINSVANTVTEVSSFVEDIDGIGSEIKMLALNARIRAALTGEEAEGLGVIAESIKQHSVDACLQTNVLADILNGITVSTERLHGVINAEAADCRKQEENETLDLKAVLKSLHNTNSDIISMVKKTNELAKVLSGDISRTVDGVTVHYTFSNSINRITPMLEQIMIHSNSFASDSFGKSENLKFQKARYTTHSERKVHTAVEKSLKGDKRIEGGGSGSGAGTDFGDNVELF